ncbi:hypothetical protein Sps_03677 [Shewanella psychrophila]|uniref:Uncharacterized protein n=1 Tax=Shewanella psychrophila TaxID=225848 RepID=A0A1S6HTE0_9GAMM|nr:hypothetical protein [Shewanella psychrophila]AQS38795.1 hypothetical protein Sps_03677 [Shewanella psychrophila]
MGFYLISLPISVPVMTQMVITFATTKERVTPAVNESSDLSIELNDLCKNLPFIILPLLATTLFFTTATVIAVLSSLLLWL